MPLPIADILRSGAPEGASEPMPGLQAAPPPPQAPPLSIEQGVSDMRRGAGLREQAVEAALARQGQTDQMRAAEMGQHREAFDPLQAQIGALTSQPLPPVEAPPALPLPPDLQVRPFLQGTPGEPPEQSLHKAVLGLSVLAQMGFGAASGVPELSLRTLAGAMQGWQEGDILRGDREFGQWQATVSTLQKDYQNRRQLVEDIVTRNRGDVERTRVALLTELARHGASMQELQALTESDQAYFALLDRQGQVIQDLGAQEANIGLNMEARQMDAQWKAATIQMQVARMQQDAAQHREGLGLKERELALKAKEVGPKLSDEGSLRQQFLSQAQDFIVVRDSYARIQEAAKSPSAAGDLALIFNYMKLLDPNSVVRESEFATAQNSAGVPERIRAQYNRALSGERLSDETRKDFVTQAAGQFNAQRSGYLQLESQFRGVAERAGIDPAQITVDLLGAHRAPLATGAPPSAPSGPTSSGGDVLSRRDPLYQKARQRGLSDAQITSKYGLTLTD